VRGWPELCSTLPDVLAPLALATALLVTLPERTSYLFTLDGLPAGQVTLERSADGKSFTYRSEHVFGRGSGLRNVESRTLAVDGAGRMAGSSATPVSLWLWTEHSPSCLEVVDELTGRTGQACSNAVSREELEGIALDAPFHAVYRDGVLETLDLGPARFTRLEATPVLDGAGGLWARGFPLPGGRGQVTFEPPLSLPRQPEAPSTRAAGWASQTLKEFGPPADAERCLDSSQRLLAWLEERGVRGVLVLGLLLDAGRAWPHAWVRASGPYEEPVDLDPAWSRVAVLPGYLALQLVAIGAHGLEAGQVYLDLVSGKRRLARR
jgi:Transglutaminase-like superfamily